MIIYVRMGYAVVLGMSSQSIHIHTNVQHAGHFNANRLFSAVFQPLILGHMTITRTWALSVSWKHPFYILSIFLFVFVC